MSLRFDVGGKVLYDCHGVIARPRTSRECANRLVGTDQSVCGTETYKSCALGDDGSGWTEDGRGVLLVVAHRLQSLRRGPKRNQLVVAASAQTVSEKNFLQLQSVGGIGSIHQESAAAQLRNRMDVGLGDEFVRRCFATHEDDDIGAGVLDHGHGIVNRAVRNVGASIG